MATELRDSGAVTKAHLDTKAHRHSTKVLHHNTEVLKALQVLQWVAQWVEA